MNLCEHCGEYLPTLKDTVVLCSCEASRSIETLERENRRQWRRRRTQAMKERRLNQRIERRKELRQSS